MAIDKFAVAGVQVESSSLGHDSGPGSAGLSNFHTGLHLD